MHSCNTQNSKVIFLQYTKTKKSENFPSPNFFFKLRKKIFFLTAICLNQIMTLKKSEIFFFQNGCWQPSWISDNFQKQQRTVVWHFDYTLKISRRSVKAFDSYRPETKPKILNKMAVVAILDFGFPQKSKRSFSLVVRTCPENFNAIGRFVPDL